MFTALELILKNQTTKSPFLDLSNCGIKDILPEELFSCYWLEGINVGNFVIEGIPSSHNVENKNSFANGYINNLEKLPNLIFLECADCNIRKIDFVENLHNIETLNLQYNEITDIKSLKKLKNLKFLNLKGNDISDISYLKGLKELKSLNLSYNNIEDYSFIDNLPKINSLFLRGNKINNISFLQSLHNLNELDLCLNSIEEIRSLEKLTELRKLDISANKIQNLKPLLQFFKKNVQIDFSMNPVTSPPVEILNQGYARIVEYFSGEHIRLNECKLIFLGDGRVGKTSLMKRIVFNQFDIDESTTHGINKILWNEIKNEKGEEVRVNLWDFGGQDIQHSLHQFFYTHRVIYVLVLDPANDTNASYWLEQIEKLGCNSDILIVYNWKQIKDQQADYLSNFYELKKKFPKLNESYLLSCQTGDGIELFKSVLISCILKNEGLKTEYLREWFEIKRLLENEVSIEKNFITYDVYKKLCNKVLYTDLDNQKGLLKILDSIGSIVFFDRPILNDIQILNPNWLTTGAYSILVDEITKKNKGKLNWNDLTEIFKTEKEVFSNKIIKIKYEESQFLYIIELMREYDILQYNPFPENELEKEYLIPSAFTDTPNHDFKDHKINSTHYRFNFQSKLEMLIIHRFIARNLNKTTSDNDYWRSGIFIKHFSSDTYALVETNLHSNEINCWISGTNRNGFWEVIRSDFREILKTYKNFTMTEEVLYNYSDKKVFLSYTEMLDCLKNGIKTIQYHPTHGIKNIDVLAVLNLFEDKEETQKKLEANLVINQPIFNGNIGSFGNNNTNILSDKSLFDPNKTDKNNDSIDENKLVKKWKLNSLKWFSITSIFSIFIIFLYINEFDFFVKKEDWKIFKSSPYDFIFKFIFASIWTYFVFKVLYDRFLDPSKEKSFRDNLKNKK